MTESEQATRGPVTPVLGTQTTEEAGLCGLADVAVVQAADFGKLHDLSSNGSSIGLRSGASLSSARWVRA